jgi:hypothetical protein
MGQAAGALAGVDLESRQLRKLGLVLGVGTRARIETDDARARGAYPGPVLRKALDSAGLRTWFSTGLRAWFQY